MSTTSSSTDARCVELRLPAAAEWLSLARTTGAAVASRWSFTVDDIADLRLAIDELCLTLVDGAPAEAIELSYSLDGDVFSVRGRTIGTPARTSPPATISANAGATVIGDLSARILDALVDEHGSEDDGSERSAWLRKRRVDNGA